jgi:hypothetical protein
MKRWISNGLFGTLGIVGCVLWTGCGGGGKSVIPAATELRYARAAENPGVIHLAWTPSTARSILGYSVRRRFVGEETFTSVANRLIPGASYTDQLPDPTEVRTIVYQVIAVASTGRTSEPIEVTAIVAPPEPPPGF